MGGVGVKWCAPFWGGAKFIIGALSSIFGSRPAHAMSVAAPETAPPTPSAALSAEAVVHGRLWQFYQLTKPRVVQLIVFCALIGMVLAVPGVPDMGQALRMLLACLGIWLVAGAAAAFNCLIERAIDARMKRTAWRPTAQGQLSSNQALAFSAAAFAPASLTASRDFSAWAAFLCA